jgi:hypothetical protein
MLGHQPVSGDRLPMKLITVGIVATLVLHFAWEMLQAPAFEDFAESTWEGTLRCFTAALGDVLLASGAYIIAALAFRHVAWPVRRGWIAPAAVWIALGIFATVVFERWALSRGRWAYGPEMPLVLGIGLLPLLQWLIVPMLTLVLVRRLAARWFSSEEQGADAQSIRSFRRSGWREGADDER